MALLIFCINVQIRRPVFIDKIIHFSRLLKRKLRRNGWTHQDSHESEDAHECRRGAHEESREAFRDRLLQEQSAQLEEQNVSFYGILELFLKLLK